MHQPFRVIFSGIRDNQCNVLGVILSGLCRALRRSVQNANWDIIKLPYININMTVIMIQWYTCTITKSYMVWG